MKVLFISSGFHGAYVYIEAAIKQAFEKLTINLCQNRCIPVNEFSQLENICKKESPTHIITLLGYKLPHSFLTWVQDAQIPLILWQTEDPYSMDLSLEVAPFATHILTIEKAAWNYYQQKGYHSLHLPLGADYSIFKPIKQNKNFASDLCLIGYPYPERVDMITFLAESFPVTINVAGNWYPYRLPSNVNIVGHWLSPQESALYYSNSKIVLNSFRNCNLVQNKNSLSIRGLSPNNRLFEAAGCHTCQLSELREDWSPWFNSEDIATFSNYKELFEQTEGLLNDSHKRQTYATNSFKTATAKHSYMNRLSTLLEWI
ncbi:CgeB family protein [Alkalicoccobacillus porphyridii]|uniref:Glycosyltransferase n=1 Tax=Alkalicoccobacillus porphyridii TaxID=2597270 RepID=A0A553ZXA5_9BACI|nr:glycosyltransferase [Alkalicoccobacillus porphyridii]TSB46090.1 glycosyltransferase [Alkalicoccobacillus porphyridii]